jgi:hypothetical protein
MAEGDVDPGLNIDNVEAKQNETEFKKANMKGTENPWHTRNLLYQVANVLTQHADAIHFRNREG